MHLTVPDAIHVTSNSPSIAPSLSFESLQKRRILLYPTESHLPTIIYLTKIYGIKYHKGDTCELPFHIIHADFAKVYSLHSAQKITTLNF